MTFEDAIQWFRAELPKRKYKPDPQERRIHEKPGVVHIEMEFAELGKIGLALTKTEFEMEPAEGPARLFLLQEKMAVFKEEVTAQANARWLAARQRAV